MQKHQRIPKTLKDPSTPVQVGALGRKQCGGLFLLADDLLNLTALHAQLALSVAEMLPISIATLFSEDAKRLAGSADPSTPRQPGTPRHPGTSFQSLMNSPWKVCALCPSPRLGLPFVCLLAPATLCQ